MDDSHVEHIFNEVILQDTYPGKVCPNEKTLVQLMLGDLNQKEIEMIYEHLETCHECKRAVDELKSASLWFIKNKGKIFKNVVEAAAAFGIEPWVHCPKKSVLDLYHAQAFSSDHRGERLKKTISDHLNVCKKCSKVVESIKATSRHRIVITLEELGRKARKEIVKSAHDLLQDIYELAILKDTCRPAYAVPGYRSQKKRSISAVMLDRDGNIDADENGQIQEFLFNVTRADLENDGYFTLCLETTTKSIWKRAKSAYFVTAVLCQETRRIVFPSEVIGSQGRLTIVGKLVSGIEIRNLPLEAIELTVSVAENYC